MGGDELPCWDGPWEPVPWYKPQRWFGWSLRRWIYGTEWEHAGWRYGRPRRIAKEELARLYDRQ